MNKRKRQDNKFPNHQRNLEHLVRNLYKININISDIDWILKEPIWLDENDKNRYLEMCDLIIVHKKIYSATNVELKSTSKHRDKAIRQLIGGRNFVINNLHIQSKNINSIIAFYGRGVINYEEIDI